MTCLWVLLHRALGIHRLVLRSGVAMIGAGPDDWGRYDLYHIGRSADQTFAEALEAVIHIVNSEDQTIVAVVPIPNAVAAVMIVENPK
jgi:hypothetical protein